MRALGPYNPSTRLPDPTLAWQNERIELGYEGSIPPAEFYNDIYQELKNVLEAAGLDLEATSLTTPINSQLLQAIQSLERITESRVIYVPGDFSTAQDALQYLSTVRIDNMTLVTLRLAGGTDHVINSEVASLLVSHPYGDRIEIVGDTLTGAGFPTAAEMDIADKTAAEALLRTRFPTILKVVGTVPGVFQKGGSLRRLANVCLVGDFSTAQDGVLIGQFEGAIGFGNIRLENVWAFNMGGNGIRSNYNAAIAGQNVGASHCGGSGFLAANMSGIQVGGAFIAVRNGVCGVASRDTSFVEGVVGSACRFNRNGIGLIGQNKGNLKFQDAANVEIRNNTSFGSLTSLDSELALPAATTGGGNGGVDVQADVGSTVTIFSASNLTISPAANTVGNNNSYIRVA